MPRHKDNGPRIHYDNGELKVGDDTLPTCQDPSRTLSVSTMGLKKFRSLIRKKKKNSESFSVYQVRSINALCSRPKPRHAETKDSDVIALEKEFETVFRDDLPEGLPPKRAVDHKIETDPDEAPPHRGIFQLSPAELVATKEYITDLLKKRRFARASPHMGPLPSLSNRKVNLEG